MLHAASILLFSSLTAGSGALLTYMLRNERDAVFGALLMKTPATPPVLRPVRVTQVRYAARLRPRHDQAPAFRAAA